MKKIMFTLLAFFLLVNITYAMNLSLKFKSTSTYPPETINLFYKNGYVFIDTTNIFHVGGKVFQTTVSYYDADGKVPSTKDFDFITEKALVDGEDLYLFVTKKNPSDSNKVNQKYIIKLDSNLNIKKEIFINENINIEHPFELCSFEKVDIKNNEIILKIHERSPSITYYFKVDKSLNTITQDTSGKSIFEEEQISQYLIEQTSNDIYEIAKNKDRYVTLRYVPTNCDNPDTCVINAALTQYDKDYNKKWEVELKDFYEVFNLVTNDQYIIVYGITDSTINKDKEDKGDIIIYDYNGNLIKTVKGVQAKTLALNEKELIYTEGGIGLCNLSYFENENNCYTKAYHAVYKLVYDITTTIKEGKGKINVVPFAQSGEGITVEIKPDEGYELGEAIVTDANGNKIKFTDYKFTMPSDDVLIEARFVKAKTNPETKDTIITTAILLFILSLIVIIVERKNIKPVK